jgi:hypothetical protein
MLDVELFTDPARPFALDPELPAAGADGYWTL